jgi:uncharacterized protein
MKVATKYYLDTSALLPYYRAEDTSQSIQNILSNINPPVLISSLTMVEVASALARWVRMNELSDSEANLIELTFKDDIKKGFFIKQPLSATSFKQAEQWLLARNTALRTLDALHLACAWSQKAILVTSDNILSESAKILGIRIIVP